MAAEAKKQADLTALKEQQTAIAKKEADENAARKADAEKKLRLI